MRLYRLSPPPRSPHVFSTSQRGVTTPSPRLQLVPGWAVLAQVWEAAGPRERVVIRATALAAQSPSRVFCGLTGLLLSGLPTPTPPFITTAAGSRSHLGKQRRPSSAAASTHRRHHHPQPGPAGLKTHLETRTDGNGFRVAAHTLCAWEVLTAPDFPTALATADALAKHSDTLALETWPALRTLIETTPYPVRTRRLERALDAARASSESVAESMSRALMLEWGFPEPVLQQDHFDAQGFIGRSDFCWPDFKLIGEFDGTAKYLDPAMTHGASARDVIRREKDRENRLRAAGWRIVRWQWSDVVHPERLRAALWSAGLRPAAAAA